jgi:TldD protein
LFVVFMMVATALGGSAQDILQEELSLALSQLQSAEATPHYVSIALTDQSEVRIVGEMGGLIRDNQNRIRTVDVDLRVGTPELDSSHPLRGFSALDGDDRGMLQVPFDDGFALRHAVRSEMDRAYREASERIVLVRANRDVKVAEEDTSPDFEPRESVLANEQVDDLEFSLPEWRATIEELSGLLAVHPQIYSSTVGLTGRRLHTTFVDSEGSRLVHGRLRFRVGIQARAVADDGDVVHVVRTEDVHEADRLPSHEELQRWVEATAERLVALKHAPRGEPYSGPVLLRGRASAVFVHEVFGHRVEGHRQKREHEGKTFLEYVGSAILPEYISIYDDPTLDSFEGTDLNGHYAFDDEGVPAQRVALVEDGVFRGFLMQRSPIRGFANSNGHGRRSVGNPPAARMGNTMVRSSKEMSSEKLRAMLLRQIRDQGLEYGYIVEDIDGGFTLTGRMMPNAFNVRASASWRVYADGRPDELVRGIDLVGTPLVAFNSVLASDDDYQVFNGTCGAESGWVPVSAVAPGLLFQQLEFQLKEKGQERPPLLPKPTSPEEGSASLQTPNDSMPAGAVTAGVLP